MSLEDLNNFLPKDRLVGLAESALEDSKKWFPKVATDLFFVAACMAGETGEVLNLLKKVARGTHPFDEDMAEEVKEEIVDVFTYMLGLAAILKMDLEAEYWKKREANSIRFSARRALTESTQPMPQITIFDKTAWKDV